MTADQDTTADRDTTDQDRQPAPSERPLSPEARRALAEAEQRRRAADAAAASRPREVGGQAGPDPVRYGDWEKAGIVSDF